MKMVPFLNRETTNEPLIQFISEKHRKSVVEKNLKTGKRVGSGVK